ncbi:MAG: cysteine-rich CWC family protein [Bacteroidales bacterium]|nr:cysteine-rich CWC family protein [Bacteroidales bacterium]MDE5609693.1 cysteine-rich CWC family protein [Bacteroidales bacterium]
MEKTCPRCGATFICKEHEDIRNCQCASVRLSENTRTLLQTRYAGRCLCARCLSEIEAEMAGKAGGER